MSFLNYTFVPTDLERQQQHTNNDLERQLQEKDAKVNQLKQELQNQTRENNKLQDGYNGMSKFLEALTHIIGPFIQYNRGKVVKIH